MLNSFTFLKNTKLFCFWSVTTIFCICSQKKSNNFCGRVGFLFSVYIHTYISWRLWRKRKKSSHFPFTTILLWESAKKWTIEMEKKKLQFSTNKGFFCEESDCDADDDHIIIHIFYMAMIINIFWKKRKCFSPVSFHDFHRLVDWILLYCHQSHIHRHYQQSQIK